MKKEHFYYGEELRLSQQSVLTNSQGGIIGYTDFITLGPKLPRVTICGIFNDETQNITFGVARCDCKDNFVKSIGRKLAFERAKNSPYRTVFVHSLTELSKVFMANAYDIENEVLQMSYPIKLY